MKKGLILVILLSFSYGYSQFNQDAPWMKGLNIEQRKSSNPVTFQEIVQAFDSYWKNRDPNVKGSGYKPFKRWENYWQNFINENGLLPTSADLWDTWQIFQNENQNRSNVDESNWQPVGPFTHTNTGSWSSGQGRVNSIIVDPNNPDTYYSGAPAGGLWKSDDAGQTWDTTTDALPQIGVSGIAIDYNNSNIIYIATGDDDGGDSSCVGVMKSTDGGITWNTTGLSPNNTPGSMNDIYIHPANSNILWVATSNGVYKTTDAGVNWSNTNGTANLNIKDIKINPANPEIIYAVTTNRFYKSTNGGDTFNSIMGNGLPTGANRMVIDVTPDNPDVVYLLSANNSWGFQGLYKSTNQGNSFIIKANQTSVGDIFESTQAWYDMALAVSDSNEEEVYVGVLNVWKTSNSGLSFTKINNWNAPFAATYTHADIHLLRYYNGNLFVGSDGGFYKSTNSAVSFTDLTAGMQISQFYKIAVAKQTSDKMVGGLQDNGGHAFSNNQWQNYYGADGMDTAIDPNNSDAYYGFTQFGGTLNISGSAGGDLSSQVSSPGSEDGNWVTPLVMNSESELYSGFSRLYKLNGSSWTAISSNLGTNIDKLEIDDLNPDNIYVATNNILRKSTNRGVSFSSVESFSSNITSIEVNTNDSNIVYVTTSGTSSGRVYMSTDGGNSFTNITGSLPGVTKNCVKHQNLNSQNPLFLATSLGVYRYDDSTADWELFNTNLPNVTVTDIEINVFDNIITASTYGRGIWQSPIPVEIPSDDIKLVEVTGVSSSVSCDSAILAQVNVENNGQNNINTVTVTYYVDNVPSSFDWIGTIAPGNTEIIPIPEFNVGSGTHDFYVNTTIINDTYDLNNNSEQFVIYANEPGVANAVNEFETTDEQLLVIDEGTTGQYWQRGVPTGQFLRVAHSGTQVYGTNLAGDYADGIKSYLISNCYDLTNVSSPELSFYMAYQLEEDWDIVYVEYSTDSGTSWSVLGSASDPNWYNSDTTAGENNTCFNCPGAQWTGTDLRMQEYVYDLSGFANASNIMFRIVFHSDASVVEEGAIVDDLVVRGTLSTEEFTANNFSIYPNPSSNVFNIKMNQMNSFDYEVYNISGQLIMQNRGVNPTGNSYPLNMENYAAGVYFLKLTSNNNTVTKKLILN